MTLKLCIYSLQKKNKYITTVKFENMGDIKMNCYDNCKYFQDTWDYKENCELSPDFKIPDDTTFCCSDYVEVRNCLTCKYSTAIIYETGTIDCIEYRCGFNKRPTWTDKVIYNDSEPMISHHYNIPECPNGHWEGDDI